MKFFTQILSLAFLLIAMAVSGQSFEGKITMKVEALELPEEMQSMSEMFKSTVTIYSKGLKSRTESKTPMGSAIIITDNAKKESIMCMDMRGKKIALVSKYDEQDKKDAEAKVSFDKSTFELTTETKTIAGYKCTKAIWHIDAEDKDAVTEIWFTKDIPNTSKDYNDLPGMPMEYSFKMQGVVMHYIVTEVIKQSVADSNFVIPVGYELKTEEEMKKMFPAFED
jgi:GLPGLI family protein